MNATPQPARVSIDFDRVIAPISPLLFGGFAEHMGRCIYEGIYDPRSPHADEDGLRTDVLAALRELNYRIIRYPGGNFVSGYNWLDGVGPRAQRPRRRELAWHSIETNQFGTHEFMRLCQKLGTQPMLAVNLGTGTIQSAADLVEYCNAPVGSYYADMRARNGQAEPWGVKYWCLGNEMDGPWQIGHREAADYAHTALEAAKLMKMHDPSIKLIACGSSNSTIATYPAWDRTVLETCWEQIDYLSMHYYANNNAGDTASYLALARQFECHIDTLAGAMRYAKAARRSKHDVHLCWDEWNVWYKADIVYDGWQEAPHLIEEIYNLEDALVVAQWLGVFLRRADVLKIACVAQIVNIIAPILTTADGLLKQSIFYPFQLFSRYASGNALALGVRAPTYATRQFGDVELLDASASHDPETGRSALFLVNRSQDASLPVELRWQNGQPQRITGIYRVAGGDPKLANSFAQPGALGIERVDAPAQPAEAATITLPPLSFSVVLCQGA